MICVVCYSGLAALVDGQYAHAECQKVPDWRPSISAFDFAVDEAIATGSISERTEGALCSDIGTALASAAAKRRAQ